MQKVAVVTGASRGAGAGIARALGQAGYKVYVTGRTVTPGSAPLPGTVGETVAAIEAAGGNGVAVALDHADDAAVAALFERVAKEDGRLDILVNNAAAIHDDLIKDAPFWELSIDLVDIIDVGLRSNYIASFHAAPLLARTRGGLVVNTSSPGSVCYLHGPAYGAQKAGAEKMASDMAVDFRPFDVSSVALWMGLQNTERSREAAQRAPEKYAEMLKMAETPEFVGRVIAHLATSPQRMALSGHVLIAAEYAAENGIVDEGGFQPMSHRGLFGEPRGPSLEVGH